MRLALLVVIPLLLIGCGGRVGLAQAPDQQEIGAAQAKGSPVAFSGILGVRNTADGIDVKITWQNISPDKTIKYARFDVEFVNEVGDVVASEMPGREKRVRLQDTGPYPPGGKAWGGQAAWERAFYHPNASTLRVVAVSVDYTDGSKIGPIDVLGLPGSSGTIEKKDPILDR